MFYMNLLNFHSHKINFSRAQSMIRIKSKFTKETAVTRSCIGTHAFARAKLAQVIAAAKHEPSFSKTKTYTST